MKLKWVQMNQNLGLQNPRSLRRLSGQITSTYAPHEIEYNFHCNSDSFV